MHKAAPTAATNGRDHVNRMRLNGVLLSCAAASLAAACAPVAIGHNVAASGDTASVGRIDVSTIPFDPALHVQTGTYTPSGSVLVSYADAPGRDRRDIKLATMNDDGSAMRTFFEGRVPDRPKDNGIRFMIFPDNKRIFMGDFVLECSAPLERCNDAKLVPVDYPAEVADGDHISHRWSEMIIAPDNCHVSWTTLLANYSAMVFTGELERTKAGYRIANTRIVSTVDQFQPDPAHPDGVIPQPTRGGEVKQFVHGGAGISVAGGARRDIADSTVLHLASGEIEAITDTPGYTETTIFSPDEQLGVVMTARFSPQTDLAVLGLMPRPYPGALNIGLNSLAYNYSVSGVRQQRQGNVGPALIDIARSKSEEGYLGANLNTSADWVFSSPLSWHPSSTRAMWMEGRRGQRGTQERRMQMVRLLDYEPGAAVASATTPDNMSYALTDLSVVKDYARQSKDIDVKVYGRHSGHIAYSRTPAGRIEKTYVNFSDDGQNVYSGRETMDYNPRANSTYRADVTLTGPKPGRMNLRMTFGPATDFYNPTKILFAPDASGQPLSSGFVEYDGQRLDVSELLP
ncbi:MAG: hypothetical protein KJZ64_11515 [Sphingomonadaceae bacterium]|nr:hypothetical protein [Sphingomonadaceae bacterium]